MDSLVPVTGNHEGKGERRRQEIRFFRKGSDTSWLRIEKKKERDERVGERYCGWNSHEAGYAKHREESELLGLVLGRAK